MCFHAAFIRFSRFFTFHFSLTAVITEIKLFSICFFLDCFKSFIQYNFEFKLPNKLCFC